MKKMKVCALFLLLCVGVPQFVWAEPSVEKTEQSKKRTITGTVISAEDKMPIIGANVWQKNSTNGTMTI